MYANTKVKHHIRKVKYRTQHKENCTTNKHGYTINKLEKMALTILS